MLLILLLILVVIIGIIVLVVFSYLDHKSSVWVDYDPGKFVGAGISISAGILLVIFGCIAIGMNCTSVCARERIAYQEKVESLNHTYTILLNAEETWDRYTAIQQYNDLVRAFKSDIKQEQELLNNPWISWFHCKAYQEFNINAVSYIENI